MWTTKGAKRVHTESDHMIADVRAFIGEREDTIGVTRLSTTK